MANLDEVGMTQMAQGENGGAVRLSNLTKVFGAELVIDSINLEIGRGEFFSLLGPSGCGKSTMMRIISGLEQATSGDVFIAGKCVNKVPANERISNMVFQQLGLFPHLNVFENVAFGLRIKRQPAVRIRQQVEKYLDLVGMGAFAHRYPAELSGGQRQRVAIARALVNEPAVLLLDEPLGALDLRLRQRMQVELKAIQRQLGTTFIYVTHDQSEAFTMSDRIAVMNVGRIEQIGSPREIYLRPATSFVANFVGETNLFEGSVLAIRGDVATVAFGGRETDVPAGTNLSVGAGVVLTVRPERIWLEHRSESGILSGIVRNSIYLGAFQQLFVDVGGGKVVTVHLTEVEEWVPGMQVGLRWRPQDAVALPVQ